LPSSKTPKHSRASSHVMEEIMDEIAGACHVQFCPDRPCKNTRSDAVEISGEVQ
jgi:hypothetical protein